MDKFKKGDHVRVDNFYSAGKSIVGIYESEYAEKNLYWIDLKLMDSSPGHTVFTGIERENCHKITEQEWFKFKLQGKGIGLYES